MLLGAAFGYYRQCMNPYRGTVQEFVSSRGMEERIGRDEAEEDLTYLLKRLQERHPAWRNADEERFINDFTQMWAGRPVAIDGVPTEEILRVYKETSSYEAEFYADEQFFGNSVVSENGLRLCGIDTSDGVVMTFEEDGEQVDYAYTFVPLEEVTGYEQGQGEDNWTYSAAMDFAMLLVDNELGVIVGEPSGNLPESYGDCLYFQMPNSRLVMSVSFKKWYRIDRTKSKEPLMPDYEVSAEKALDKVYELIR